MPLCVCVSAGRGVQKKLSRNRLSNSAASSERTPLLISQDSSTRVSQGSNSIQAPSTPPVIVEARQNAPGSYDTQSLSEAEWERSTETFHVKSTTPSMNNYAEFSTSVDVTPAAAAGADHPEGAGGADTWGGGGDVAAVGFTLQAEGAESGAVQGQPAGAESRGGGEVTDEVPGDALEEESLEKSTIVIA